MVTPLLPPQLVINQRFAVRPAGTQRRTSVLLFGGLAQTVRFNNTQEKQNGFLGIYDDSPDLIDGVPQTLYTWPHLNPGNTVDPSFTKLFVEDGLFRYFTDDSKHAVLRSQRNLVRLPDYILSTDLFGVSNVVDSGIQVGDIVRILGLDDQLELFEFFSYVIGVRGDLIPASVGTPQAAETNYVNASASTGSVQYGGNWAPTDIEVTPNANLYDGRATGHMTEMYTLTVIEPGTVGGAGGNIVLSVTSASGQDNTAPITLTNASPQTIAVGTRGLTVVLEADSTNSLQVGDFVNIAIQQKLVQRTLAISGSYIGNTDRTYIVQVVDGGNLSDSTTRVRVTSQDGTDITTIKPAGPTFSLGSFGLIGTFTATDGLSRGDTWVVNAVASKEGIKRTVILAHELPNNVLVDNVDAELEVSFYRKKTAEIPYNSVLPGINNYETESTQIKVRGGIVMTFGDITLGGTAIESELVGYSDKSEFSKLFVNYRAWYPASSDVFSITSRTDLSTALEGVTDPDNPLKYGVSVTRQTAGGETIYVYNVGDPTNMSNWQTAFDRANRSRAVYSYVPLTHNQDVLQMAAAAVSAANSTDLNSYRVLWASSERVTNAPVLDSSFTTNNAVALAVVEDNVLAAGTQYTQVRITSGNADLQTLGIRVGDLVRYNFSIDNWGNEVYDQRIVTEVRSATTLIVDSSLGQQVIPYRIEIHRNFNSTDLRSIYGQVAASWNSDLVRFVLAPEIQVGSFVLPSFYAAAMVAGLRSNLLPHAPLSTQAIPGVQYVFGLDLFSDNDLNIMAAQGAMICHLDENVGTVRVRHGVTTGDTNQLALREESMVTARHIALFTFHSRLEGYVGRINLSEDGDEFDILSEQIRAELESAGNELRTFGFTPELGGVIRGLTITSIQQSTLQADELIIDGELELGKPGNKITFNVLVR